MFVYPSIYEGFGLPLLEAMKSGVPVITSNVTSLPEIAGDAACLVDPLDVSSIGAGIERLANDNAMRSELVSRGLNRAAQFTWDRAARET